MGTNQPTTGQKAADYLRRVAKIVEDKSDAYGDSVGQPLRIFSKNDQADGLRVRIDDKLSRIARGNPAKNNGEDIVQDLIGYLALLAVSTEMERRAVPSTDTVSGWYDRDPISSAGGRYWIESLRDGVVRFHYPPENESNQCRGFPKCDCDNERTWDTFKGSFTRVTT